MAQTTSAGPRAVLNVGLPARPLNARARIALAAGGGLLLALSLPPWGWWPLTFVGITLYAAAADSAPTRRAAAWCGFAFGAPWMLVGMAWMTQLTVAGFVPAVLAFAGFHALAGAAAPRGRAAVLGRPLAHTLVEALRFSFPFGGVPLASVAIAQAGGPFIGIARVGGAIALTWFGFQAGALLAVAARHASALRHGTPPALRGRPAWPTVTAAVLLVLLIAVAVVAPRGRDTGQTLHVAAVQGGGEQGTSALQVPSRLVTERLLAATATIAAPLPLDAAPDDALDMVLWPENGISVDDLTGSDVLAEIGTEAARLDVPFLVGVTEDVAGRPDRFTNAQVVVGVDGVEGNRYDKVRRVPFGEYVPLRGLLTAVGAPIERIGRDALAGSTPAVLSVPTRHGDVPVAVAISWEIFFGGRANEGVAAGGQLLVNPTNGASYTGTIVQTQQIASSRLRAVETGRWVVQVAPTGFSAIVGADGTVHERTAISEQRVLRAEVPLHAGRTWYSRLGDAPFIVVALAAFAAVTLADRRRGDIVYQLGTTERR